jgi:hypothetical protein
MMVMMRERVRMVDQPLDMRLCAAHDLIVVEALVKEAIAISGLRARGGKLRGRHPNAGQVMEILADRYGAVRPAMPL